MSLYQWLLLVHILAGMIWFGGVVYAVAMFARNRDTQSRLRIYRATAGADAILLPPAIILIGAAGIWMVIDNPVWEFEQTWIALAIVLYAANFVLGVAYFTPMVKKVEALVSSTNEASAEVRDRLRQVEVVGQIHMVALAVIVLLMVWKPGG